MATERLWWIWVHMSTARRNRGMRRSGVPVRWKPAALIAACALFCGCATSRSMTVHVNGAAGDDGNNGLSRAAAVRTIQKALDIARDGTTVVVDDGIYKGDGNRELDFRGKKVYLKSSDGRRKCIIDCEGDGRAFLFHCNEDGQSVVEGFTVRNGDVCKGSGELLYNEIPDGIPRGGAVFCLCSGPSIKDCHFENCRAGRGGAIYCYKSNPVIAGCRFICNQAGEGAAVSCAQGSCPRIESCLMEKNGDQAGPMGFSEGGVVCCVDGSDAVITGCKIKDNRGTGIACSKSSPAISGCMVSGCKVEDDDWGSGGTTGIYLSDGGTPGLIGCIVTDNSGCGIDCSEVTVKMTGCTVSGNGGYGVEVGESELTVERCVIEGNDDEGIRCGESVLVVLSSEIKGSSEDGGIHCVDCEVTVANSLIADNDAEGIDCDGKCMITVSNCTVAGNGGRGISFGGGCEAVVSNTLVWGNRGFRWHEVSIGEGGTLTMNYCLLSEYRHVVQEAKPGEGIVVNGCIHEEPQFVDAGKGDYRLKAGFPGIDAGLNAFAPNNVKKDLAGKARIVDGNGDGKAVVDIGALEYQGK